MSAAVERREIAPTLSIARVVTGLWQIADVERDGRSVDLDATARAMRPYAEAGFTTFDMADHYGSAEEIAGRFVRQHGAGQPVELLTKWVPKPGALTRETVRAAVQRSLDCLRVEAVDLLQFHAWNYADPSWLDGLFYLQELKREGLIRHLGLTNVDAPHLAMALQSGIEIVSNQVCFSLLDRRPLHGLTAVCQAHGVGLLAYGTLAGGFLTARWIDAPEPDWERLETWPQMKYGRFIRAAGGWTRLQAVLRAVQDVAERHGVTPANVASRYVLEQPAVAGVIIGARLGLREHVDENTRLFSFRLTAADRRQIDAAVERLDPLPGNSGDEYRRPPYLTASGDLSHHIDALPPPYKARTAPNGRSIVLTGTPWEPLAGYARAVRVGNRILVSGTTATHGERVIGGADAAAQLHFVIDKIEGAIQSLGGRLDHVVRTRVFVRDIADWEAVARAHGERFGSILPANTLVQAGLIGEEYLVEVEAEAVVE